MNDLSVKEFGSRPRGDNNGVATESDPLPFKVTFKDGNAVDMHIARKNRL